MNEGDVFTVEWTATPVDSVLTSTIELSSDNGSNWSQIGTTNTNDFDFEWTVPALFSTTCLIRVSVVSNTEADADTSDATFTVRPLPDVTVTTPDGGELYETGDVVTVTWTVTTDPDITDNVIEYSTDGGTNWINIGTTDDEDFDIDWTIPDMYNLYTVVRVTCTDEFDNEDHDVSNNWFKMVPVEASRTFYRGWSFFSLPYTPDDNTVETLIENEITDDMPWDLFGFHMHTGHFRPDTFITGNGYMLTMFQDSLVMDFDNDDVGVDPVDWDLHLGWNLVGVPFGQPLTVANQTVTKEGGSTYTIVNAANDGLCIPTFYSWSAEDSAYETASTLDVWKCYYFVSLDTLDLNLYPAAPGAVPTATDEFGTFEQWELNISATMDGRGDRMAVIGANVDATDGFDAAFDYPKPPPGTMRQVVNTYFNEPEWLPNFSQDFFRDVRAQLVDETAEWTMYVRTIRPGDVTLSWEDIFETTPPGYEFEIVDPVAEVTINPRAEESYTFHNDGTREIIIRTIASLGVETDVELPESHDLLSAYPNPFNPTLNIKMNLRSYTNVTLNVYDLAGKLVNTIANGSYSAGSHDITWDGSNITSGVYFVRMNAGKETATIKVLLMKQFSISNLYLKKPHLISLSGVIVYANLIVQMTE